MVKQRMVSVVDGMLKTSLMGELYIIRACGAMVSGFDCPLPPLECGVKYARQT
jgi:hypothetical protein